MSAMSSLITFNNGLGMLWLMVILPVLLGAVCFLLSRRSYGGQALVFMLGATVNLVFALFLLFGEELTVLMPWAGFEINLALRLYGFAQLMLFMNAVVFFIAALYSITFMRRNSQSSRMFFYCLLALGFCNGVFLSNNFMTLLFFWEGILVACFAAQLYNDKPKVLTAVKTLVLGAVGDIMLMIGVAVTATQSGTLMMDVISSLPVEGPGALGFAGLVIGSLARACAVPFHSWLPDTAAESPVPFVILLPICVERLTGAYLLLRVCGGFYDLQPGSAWSVTLMIIGAFTLLAGGMMALVKRNMKRLTAFLTIAQSGLLLLGAGSAVPGGLDGALLSLIAQTPALLCLFMASGQIERTVGSANLRYLGGLGRSMPLTGLAFLLAACCVGGVPPFGSFFANQLILGAVNDVDTLLYIFTLLGLFFVACALLRVSISCFFGPLRLPEGVRQEQLSEAPGIMILCMGLLALGGLAIGVFAGPITASVRNITGSTMQGWSFSAILLLIYVIVLLMAILNHITGFRATGESLRAADHIHYLPGLYRVFDAAERHYLDPYNVLMSIVRIYSWLCRMLDRCLTWVFESMLGNMVSRGSGALHDFNLGIVNQYLLWALGGLVLLVLLFLVLV